MSVWIEELVIANVDPGALYRAMQHSLAGIVERTCALPEPTSHPVDAYVLMHLKGTTVRPWSVLGRGCVFGTRSDEPGFDRVFIALKDTTGEDAGTAKRLLELMLAKPSG